MTDTPPKKSPILPILLFLALVAAAIFAYLYFSKKCPVEKPITADNFLSFCPKGYYCGIRSTAYDNFGFKYQANTDYSNDPSLSSLGEVQSTLPECFTTCASNPKCKGFGVEINPGAAATGNVKCWFKNSDDPKYKSTKNGAAYFVKDSGTIKHT